MDRKLRTLRTSQRLSVFLRKERSDRGARRLSNKVEKIIDAAIKKIYLTAERPDRSQSYSQIALLHSHLFLHDQLTFADISGTDSTITSAVLDRLLHHAETVLIEGSSYRMKDRIES